MVTKGEAWGKQRDKLGDWYKHINTTIYEIYNQQGSTAQYKKLYSIFFSKLYGKRI